MFRAEKQVTFVKGQSGNPGGRPTSDKAFADALRIALARRETKGGETQLARIADKLVKCALAGQSWAIQHVADRVDGKPAQESTVNLVSKALTELADAEIAARLEQLRAGGAAALGGDAEAPRHSSELN